MATSSVAERQQQQQRRHVAPPARALARAPALATRQAGQAHGARLAPRAAATGRAAPAAAAAPAARASSGQRRSCCGSSFGAAGVGRRHGTECAGQRAGSLQTRRAGGAGRQSAACASSRSSSVASSSVSAPERASASRSAASRASAIRGVALAEGRVGGVDEQLLAGFGVFHRHQADVGQRHLQRVVQAHRDHLVALRQARQRVLPAGLR